MSKLEGARVQLTREVSDAVAGRRDPDGHRAARISNRVVEIAREAAVEETARATAEFFSKSVVEEERDVWARQVEDLRSRLRASSRELADARTEIHHKNLLLSRTPGATDEQLRKIAKLEADLDLFRGANDRLKQELGAYRLDKDELLKRLEREQECAASLVKGLQERAEKAEQSQREGVGREADLRQALNQERNEAKFQRVCANKYANDKSAMADEVCELKRTQEALRAAVAKGERLQAALRRIRDVVDV